MPLEPATKKPRVLLNYDHDNLAATLGAAAPRQTKGTRVNDRRAKEKQPISTSDRRRNDGAKRSIQYNTNVSEEVDGIWRDACSLHDLTKAEFTERAIRMYAAELAKGNGVAE